ncbi:uncharacterized protein LOC122808793 [Protopterus annectens]|uniref:uncharacterized protein LOC122808793 n=1 Tax=Protopterus annectens TaxID=7888 RepID=UPI001CFA4B89|nr:uncharacterized protein LOC122808793 [Protopterus annectens]
MGRLTLFIISLYFLSSSTERYLKKPDIHVSRYVVTYRSQKVTVECRSSLRRYPLKRCTFYKDNELLRNEPIPSADHSFKYIIEEVTSQDEGLYTCVCYNAENQRTEESVPAPLSMKGIEERPHLEVIPWLVRYHIRSKVTLQCSSSTGTTYTQCWFIKYYEQLILHHSKTPTESKFHYEIGNVKIRDGEHYSCMCYTAQHQITMESRSIKLNVHEPVDIQVTPQGVIPIGSKITVQCSSNYHELHDCDFFKNGYIVLQMSKSSSKPIFEYIIEKTTKKDEGYYKCRCYRSDRAYIESDTVPLIVNDQIDEPEIYVEEDEKLFICASKNSNYRYWFCILYQNGQPVSFEHMCDGSCVFRMDHFPLQNNLSCLCYMTEYHPISAITNEQKHQIDEAEIHVTEDEQLVFCASKNSSYEYWLCILYRDGQQIKSQNYCHHRCFFPAYVITTPMPLACLCYTTEALRWTRQSSFITNERKRHMEKPHIQVTVHESEHKGRKVTIECSTYVFFECNLVKFQSTIWQMKRYSNGGVFYYDIQNATAEDESYYQCYCKTSVGNVHKSSLAVPLILNEQVEEPEIRMNENETEIVCASKNSSYKYWMCVLYQDGQQIQDDFFRRVDHASFDISNLPAGSNFSCLCFEYSLGRWTRNSSVITKGRKHAGFAVKNIT